MRNYIYTTLVLIIAGACTLFFYGNSLWNQALTENNLVPAYTESDNKKLDVVNILTTTESALNSITTSPLVVSTTTEKLPGPFIIENNKIFSLVNSKGEVNQLVSHENLIHLLPPAEIENYNIYGRYDFIVNVIFSPNKKWVAIDYGVRTSHFGHKKNGVGVISLEDPELEFNVLVPAGIAQRYNVQFSEDGKFLSLTSGSLWDKDNPSLNVFDTTTGNTVYKRDNTPGSITWLSSVDFSYITEDMLHVYSLDTQNGKEIVVQNILPTTDAYESVVDRAIIPEFSPDRRYISFESASSTLTVFDTITKRSLVLGGTMPLEVYCCAPPSAESLGFSGDSKSFSYTEAILEEILNPSEYQEVEREAQYEVTLLDINNAIKKEVNTDVTRPVVPNGVDEKYKKIHFDGKDYVYLFEKTRIPRLGNSPVGYRDYLITNKEGNDVCPRFSFNNIEEITFDIYAGKSIAIIGAHPYDVIGNTNNVYIDRAGASAEKIPYIKKILDLESCSILLEVDSGSPLYFPRK